MPSTLESQILRILSASGRPLLAREIAAELRKRGSTDMNRKQINQVLYAELREAVYKDDSHSWTIRDTAQGREKSREALPRMSTLDEAYQLLGVAPTVSLEELKLAYKQKIAKWHPDKVSHMAQEIRDLAASTTSRLNVAYQLIIKTRSV